MKNRLLTGLGFVFLGMGVVGVALPVMPTTPFVLLAAMCFSSGNRKFHDWLKRNRVFGPFIENYRTKQGISKAHKAGSIAFLWTGLTISMAVTQTPWLYVVLAIVGVCVTVHLLALKTRE